MRTLIIGCGYLGLRVARHWIAAGHHVSAVTRSQERVEKLRTAGIEPIVADVMSRESLRALPSADVLLYAVGYDRHAGHGRRAVYVDGLENVLREAAGRVGRLVYISSTSVYGQTNGEWVNEESPCDPQNDNGRACLDAEQVVWRHFSSNDAGPKPANVLRLSGLYGPGRLIARVESLLSGEPIGGNPDAWLNLIHVEDAAQAVVACAERGTPRVTYLISDDRPATRREYYTRLAELVGAPPPVFSAVEDLRGRTTGLNKRCNNRCMKRELTADLLYPTMEAGLPNAVLAATRTVDEKERQKNY
jgi:nucleoside-diphosphate-sugar epimerase